MRTTTFSVFDYLPTSVREFPEAPGGRIARGRRARRRRRPRARASDLVGRGSEPQSRDQRAGPQSPRRSRRDRRRHRHADARPRLHRRAGAARLLGLAAPHRAAARPSARARRRSISSESWPRRRWLRSFPRPEAGRCRPDSAASSATRCSRCRVALAAGSTWGVAAFGAAFAAIAILALTAAAGSASRIGRRPTTRRRKPRARGRAAARSDDEDGEDEPGFGIVSIGAGIHALLTAKAALQTPPPPTGQGPRRRCRLKPPEAARPGSGSRPTTAV